MTVPTEFLPALPLSMGEDLPSPDQEPGKKKESGRIRPAKRVSPWVKSRLGPLPGPQGCAQLAATLIGTDAPMRGDHDTLQDAAAPLGDPGPRPSTRQFLSSGA